MLVNIVYLLLLKKPHVWLEIFTFKFAWLLLQNKFFFLLPAFLFSLPNFTHFESETLFKLSCFDRIFFMLCLMLLNVFLITYRHLFLRICFFMFFVILQKLQMHCDCLLHFVCSTYLKSSSTIKSCVSVPYQYVERLS